MPRFIVVPAASISPWNLHATTVLEGTINGVDIGRRTIKRWDDQRWFMDLPESLCYRARVETGQRVSISLRIASETFPEEIKRLITNDPSAKAAWHRLTPSQQRMLREHVAAAKHSATRERRAKRALKR